MNTDLIKYYRERALEYEKIYLKPERQNDLKRATTLLQSKFTNRSVFEIACGTGFWTEKISQTASSVFATDINQAVIDVAQQKHYPKNNVRFGLKDIFNLSINTKYENLFGGFIWSHLKLQDLGTFLDAVNQAIVPGGTIVFMDNNYVEGSSLPITSTDEEGNTFQTRRLEDGSTHVVLKNFPTENFLQTKLREISTSLEIIHLKYFWIVVYKNRA